MINSYIETGGNSYFQFKPTFRAIWALRLKSQEAAKRTIKRETLHVAWLQYFLTFNTVYLNLSDPHNSYISGVSRHIKSHHILAMWFKENSLHCRTSENNVQIILFFFKSFIFVAEQLAYWY